MNRRNPWWNRQRKPQRPSLLLSPPLRQQQIQLPIPKARPQVPAQKEARAGRYTVVIYEKYRTGDIIQDEARIVFASQDRCDEFGERTVLRRLAPYEGKRQRPRIWYECQQAPD